MTSTKAQQLTRLRRIFFTARPKVIELERFSFGLVRFSPDGKAVLYPTREQQGSEARGQ